MEFLGRVVICYPFYLLNTCSYVCDGKVSFFSSNRVIKSCALPGRDDTKERTGSRTNYETGWRRAGFDLVELSPRSLLVDVVSFSYNFFYNFFFRLHTSHTRMQHIDVVRASGRLNGDRTTAREGGRRCTNKP